MLGVGLVSVIINRSISSNNQLTNPAQISRTAAPRDEACRAAGRDGPKESGKRKVRVLRRYAMTCPPRQGETWRSLGLNKQFLPDPRISLARFKIHQPQVAARASASSPRTQSASCYWTPAHRSPRRRRAGACRLAGVHAPSTVPQDSRNKAMP
jgi:hypothetical protein